MSLLAAPPRYQPSVRGDAMLLTHGGAGTERLIAVALAARRRARRPARHLDRPPSLVAGRESATDAPPLLSRPARPRARRRARLTASLDRPRDRVREPGRRDRAHHRRRRRTAPPPLPARLHPLLRRPRRSRRPRCASPTRPPPRSRRPSGPAEASAPSASRLRTPCRPQPARSWCPALPAVAAALPILDGTVTVAIRPPASCLIVPPSGNSPPTNRGRESLLQSGPASQLDRGRI